MGLLQDPDVENLVYTKGCLAYVTKAFDSICLTLGILTFALVGVQVCVCVYVCVCVCVCVCSDGFYTASSVQQESVANATQMAGQSSHNPRSIDINS